MSVQTSFRGNSPYFITLIWVDLLKVMQKENSTNPVPSKYSRVLKSLLLENLVAHFFSLQHFPYVNSPEVCRYQVCICVCSGKYCYIDSFKQSQRGEICSFLTRTHVSLGGLGVTCSPRDSRFAGSYPTEVDGFFQDIKILSTSPPRGRKK